MQLLILSAILIAGAPPNSVQSDHYQIQVAGIDTQEASLLLDQLHRQLADFFGTQPEGSLPIRVFSDAKSFHDALAADGHPVVEGGGYYGPENRTAYLFTQPSDYYTRQLLLHEASHQFHFLAAAGNRKPRAAWYTEGLANYFAMHDWDGKRLHCGVVPAVSLEDYPAAALTTIEQTNDRTEWLRRVIGGDEPATRPVGWALVHFLMHRDRDAFARLGARLDRSDDALASFRETIAPITPGFADEFHRWVAEHQQPWSAVWNQWQQSGEQLEGWAGVVGLIVHKQPLARLEAVVQPNEAPWKAGGVFGYRDPNDFHLLQITSAGEVRVIRRLDTRWLPVLASHMSLETNGFVIERDGDRVTVTVDGTPVHQQEAPGKLGLHIDNCRARFRVKTDPESRELPIEPCTFNERKADNGGLDSWGQRSADPFIQ